MLFIAVRAGIQFDHAVSIYTRRLAEGICLNGVKVQVFCITKDYSWQYKVINNVEYFNSMQSPNRSTWLPLRVVKYYYRTFCAPVVILSKLKRKHQLLSLLHISETDTITLYYLLLCRILKLQYFANFIENPFRVKAGWKKKVILAATRRYASGVIYISSSLSQFMGHSNTIVVPPTIDEMYIKNIAVQPLLNSQFTIGYCGTVTMEKDGFGILLNSIRLLSTKEQHKIRLLIIGDTTEPDKTLDDYKQYAKNLDLEAAIEFTGRIDNDAVINLLRGCHLLVLTRPDNYQNRYGFPSKLPEYLSTGRPVLISCVSDIPLYLKDLESAYLLKNNTPEEIANSIARIIDNYEDAGQVGKRGFQIACDVFNNRVQGKRILDFILKLSIG